MPKKKKHEFINRDIIAGLILALTKRPMPTAEELDNNSEMIVLYTHLYDTAAHLKELGYSENMPLEWLQQELSEVKRPDLTNPNITYPKTVAPLFQSIDTLIESLDNCMEHIES